MPVIREKRSYFTQPVGVVRAGADSFGVTSGIGELADSLIKGSYDTLVEQAKEKGQDLARTVKQSSFKSLNPETGQVEALKPPSTFGTAAANAYQELIETRYIASVEDEINNSAKTNFARYENDRDGYAKFSSALEEDVDSILQSVDPRFSALTESLGASLVASYESNFLVKKVKRDQVDAMNATVSIVNNNANSVTGLLSSLDFTSDTFNSPQNVQDIANTFEQIQGLLNANSRLGNDAYLLGGESEILEITQNNTVVAITDVMQAKLAEIASATNTEEEAHIAMAVILSNGKNLDKLSPKYRALLEPFFELTINGNDTFLDENGELVIEDGKSKQKLFPLVQDKLQSVMNSSMPAIRDRERDALAEEAEIKRKQNEAEIIQFNNETGPEFVETSRALLSESITSDNFSDTLTTMNNLMNEYSAGVNNLDENPTKKQQRISAYRSILLLDAADAVALSGSPTTFTNPTNGEVVENSTTFFSIEESNAITQWASTGGNLNNIDMLPDHLRNSVKEYMEFAGEDARLALGYLIDKSKSTIESHAQSAVDVKNKNIKMQIMQGTYTGKDADEQFDNVFTAQAIENAFPNSVTQDKNGVYASTMGNIFINPNGIPVTEEITKQMISSKIVSKELKSAFLSSLSNEYPVEVQANIFNTMRQLDLQTDSLGRPLNILKKSLTTEEYSLYESINSALDFNGNSYLPIALANVRQIATDPTGVQNTKVARFQPLINDAFDVLGKKNIPKLSKLNNDQIDDVIILGALINAGIDDPLIQQSIKDVFGPYINYNVAANGDPNVIFNAVETYYDNYYKPVDGIIVDPMNPTASRTAYSLENKRIGSNAESKALFVTNLNTYFNDNNIPAYIGTVEDHFSDGNRHNLAFSVGGMPAMPPSSDVAKSIGDRQRVYLMPIPNSPYGYSTQIDPTSKIDGMTENTLYIGVVKNEKGEYEPYTYTRQPNEQEKRDGIVSEVPEMMAFMYSDLDEITFAEQDKLEKDLQIKNLELANYLRMLANKSPDDLLTPMTAGMIINQMKFK